MTEQHHRNRKTMMEQVHLAHKHRHTHTHTNTGTRTLTQTQSHIHIRKHTHTHTHTHTQTHTHTHIQPPPHPTHTHTPVLTFLTVFFLQMHTVTTIPTTKRATGMDTATAIINVFSPSAAKKKKKKNQYRSVVSSAGIQSDGRWICHFSTSVRQSLSQSVVQSRWVHKVSQRGTNRIESVSKPTAVVTQLVSYSTAKASQQANQPA